MTDSAGQSSTTITIVSGDEEPARRVGFAGRSSRDLPLFGRLKVDAVVGVSTESGNNGK